MKILVALLLFLSACSWNKSHEIVIIGDSITFLATSDLEARMADYNPDISSTFGITIAESIPVAEELARTEPAVFVMNLGTNDAGVTNFEQAKKDYTEILDLFDGCKVVVNLAEAHKLGFTISPERAQFFESFNAWLANDLVGVVVVDWARAVSDHPEWVPDGVHPTATKEYAELVARGAESC